MAARQGDVGRVTIGAQFIGARLHGETEDKRRSCEPILAECPARLPHADWSDTGYWTRLTPNPGKLARLYRLELPCWWRVGTIQGERSLALYDRVSARWERNSLLSDKQLPPSGLIAAN